MNEIASPFRVFVKRCVLFLVASSFLYFLMVYQSSIKSLPIDYLAVFGVISIWIVAFSIGVCFPFIFYPEDDYE